MLLALVPLLALSVPTRAVASLEDDAEQGSAVFDGGGRYARAASPEATPQDKAQLLAELKKCIVFDDHGVPAEREAYERMLSRMMESPTATEVAVKFVSEGSKVKLSFEEIEGSTVVKEDGKEHFWGTRGLTYTAEKPPRVVLNKLFMRYDTDMGVGTLAHEMLGHAFEAQRVSSSLMLKDVYSLNINEEENARLIGWLVRTELKVTPEDEIWAYMENPEESMESIKMATPYYALTLTSAEMKDPVSVYRKRIVQADNAAVRVAKNSERVGTWGKIVNHFVKEHKMSAGAFQTIKDDINNALSYYPTVLETLKTIKQVLLEFISELHGLDIDSALALNSFVAQSDNPYFKQKDAVILERRKRLSDLLMGKTRESFKTPPVPGQITWDQLFEMWERDADACPYGGPK